VSFAAPLCEITEVNGGLTVTREGVRVSQIWNGVQNYAHLDLVKLIRDGYCSVEAQPCEIGEVDGGLTVLREGKRISQIWKGVQGFALKDLRKLQRIGVCF